MIPLLSAKRFRTKTRKAVKGSDAAIFQVPKSNGWIWKNSKRKGGRPRLEMKGARSEEITVMGVCPVKATVTRPERMG